MADGELKGQRYSVDEIADALRRYRGGVHLAARAMGCSPQTIYNRVKKSVTLQKVLDDARGEMLDVTEAKLYEAIMGGAPWAISLYLRTIGRTRGYTDLPETMRAGVLVVDWQESNPE